MRSPIRQQFTLAAEIDDKFDSLAKELGKRPNDLKKEILIALSGVPADSYYIALGTTQQIGKDSKKAKRL